MKVDTIIFSMQKSENYKQYLREFRETLQLNISIKYYLWQ